MEYAEFEKKLLHELTNKNLECLNTIENNEKIVTLYLQNTEKPIHINNIVDNINELILKETEEYDFFKKVLYHPLMKDVLSTFRESDIFVKACRQQNIKAQNWLLNMDIHNIIDAENGKTVPMYLLEQGNYEDFNKFINVKTKVSYKNFDINYRSKITNESIVSILIKKFNEMYTEENIHLLLNSDGLNSAKGLTEALISIINYPGCDFNIEIDEEGNTPIMFFIMMEDYVTVSYIMTRYPDIDLSKKNINGVNASVLSLYIKDETHLTNTIMDHKTFDYSFVDKYQNNLLIHSVISGNSTAFAKILINNGKSIHHINDHQESVLIIATKLGFLDKVSSFNLREANFNYQDSLGNTALFYAIKLKDEYAVNLLAYNGADATIKNNQGVSPLDQAKEMNEKSLLDILKKPIPIHKMKHKLMKKSQGVSFLNKEKKSDKKIENYIKNYQINNYKQDYQPFMDHLNFIYVNKHKLVGIGEPMALAYYTSLNSKDNYIPLNCFDGRTLSEIRNRVYVF